MDCPARLVGKTVEVKDSLGCYVRTDINFDCNYLAYQPVFTSNVNCINNGLIIMDTTNPNILYTLKYQTQVTSRGKGIFNNLADGYTRY